jgi:uncharacterized protein (TIGR00251 family)
MSRSCTLGVRLKPNARQDSIELASDGSLSIRVHAPPVEGKANTALVKLLADKLDIPKSCVSVLHGLASKSKVVQVNGLTKEEALARVIGKSSG